MANFQNRLRDLRKSLDLSQSELGKKFNLAKSTISQYELGKRAPDSIMLEKLADFFNVTVDYLLGRSEIKNPYAKEEPAESELSCETKSYYILEKHTLPAEAIQQIDEYIEFIKQKYDANGYLRKKDPQK